MRAGKALAHSGHGFANGLSLTIGLSDNPPTIALANNTVGGARTLRIPLKYGLMITLGLITWVVVTHLLVPNPRSAVHTFGASVFFNLLHIAGIFMAINTVRNESAGEMTFKTGLKTGVATAFFFAASSSLFFLVAILVVGPRLMASEPGIENLPLWQVALGAFAGFFLGTWLFGLIYSTVISFFLAKRRGYEDVR